MYEFTKKELREKFKETEYGKKVNKYLLISGIIFVLILLGLFVLGVLDVITDANTEEQIYNVLSSVLFIFAVIATYFDGKRDGAIEQYKRSINSKN